MKYELSETEFLETLALVRHVFDSAMKVIEKDTRRYTIREERSADSPSTWPEETEDSWGAWPEEKTESGDKQAAAEPTADLPVGEAEAFGAERFQKGAHAFEDFVGAWTQGLCFDETASLIDGVEQPDRGALVRDLGNGPNVLNVLAHVGKCGGLIHAIDQAITAPEHSEKTRRAFVSAVASVVCVTSSLLFPELSDHYEHRDIYLGKA